MKKSWYIVTIVAITVSFQVYCSAWSVPSHQHITKAAFDVLPQWQKDIWDNNDIVFDSIYEVNDIILDHLISHFCRLPDNHDGPTGLRDLAKRISKFIYAEKDGTYAQPIAYDVASGRPWTFHYFDWSVNGPYEKIYNGSKWYFEKISKALKEDKPLQAAQHFGCFAHGLEDSTAPYHCLDGMDDYRHTLWPYSNHRGENFNFFISLDSDANANIQGYKPQILGDTPEKAAEETARRFIQANQYSRSLIPQLVQAHQKDDWKNRLSGPETVAIQSLMASNNSKLIADVLYTSFCLAYPEKAENTGVRGIDLEVQEVYIPKDRPGYVAWVQLFHCDNGQIGLTFREIYQSQSERNRSFEPRTQQWLDYYQASMDYYQPYPAYRQKSDYVYLRSADNGKTWHEVYRTLELAGKLACLSGNRLIRANGNYGQSGSWDKPAIVIRESCDDGRTWKEIATPLGSGFCFFDHFLKKLSDETLILCGAITPTYGKKGYLPQRNSRLQGQREDMMTAFFASSDGGHNWTGPHYVLAGTEAHEYDFVETPQGDLLFFLSTVQSNYPARQIVRRTKTGFVNEPVLDVFRGVPTDENPQGGNTPETIVMTKDGLLIGARRLQGYTCSNDFGKNWYQIEGLPVSKYQPMMILLDNGRLLSAGHHGRDSLFGEYDMYIETQSFGIEENLPKATKLLLQRELSSDGEYYLNTFTVKFTVDGKPVANRQIELYIKPTWLVSPETTTENPVKIWQSSDVRKVQTDSNGIATFKLTDMDQIRDLYHLYVVAAEFKAEPKDNILPCKSTVLRSYAMTPHRSDPSPYPIYNVHGMITVTPETAKKFPELSKIVETLMALNLDAPFEKWLDIVGDKQRTKKIIDFLLQNHIISIDDKGIYHWYKAIHSGDPYIHGLRVLPEY